MQVSGHFCKLIEGYAGKMLHREALEIKKLTAARVALINSVTRQTSVCRLAMLVYAHLNNKAMLNYRRLPDEPHLCTHTTSTHNILCK